MYSVVFVFAARSGSPPQYTKLLGGRGENRLLIGTLLTDAQQWGQLRVLLAKHVASARSLVADYGEKGLLYDEMKCWEQECGKDGIAKKALKTLAKAIGAFEAGCTEEISELEKKTKEMIELVRPPYLASAADSRLMGSVGV